MSIVSKAFLVISLFAAISANAATKCDANAAIEKTLKAELAKKNRALDTIDAITKNGDIYTVEFSFLGENAQDGVEMEMIVDQKACKASPVISFVSSPVAVTDIYQCKSDKQAWTANVSITNEELTILNAVGPNGNGTLVYENKGLKGGNGSMAQNYRFVLSIEKSTAAYPNNNSNPVYFVQPQLLTGATKGLMFGDWNAGGDIVRCRK